jgi:hypothetical protein
MASNQRLRRSRLIRSLKPPPCLPTQFTDDQEPGCTKLNADQVAKGVVPNVYKLEAKSTMIQPLVEWLNSFYDSPLFPTADVDDWSRRLPNMREKAQMRPPSGEAGVSDHLSVTMFDRLNDLLLSYYKDKGEGRRWSVIGIGVTGKSDWGLYINGVLVAVVELKPSIVIRIHPLILSSYTDQ